MMKAFVGSILFVLCTAQMTAPAQTQFGHEPQTFLQNQLAFTANELSSLEQGQIIVRLPKPTETREVAVFAIMRLDVSEDFFLHRMRDIVNFKKSDNVLQIGKFSDPPTLKDLEALTLDSAEIDTIHQCRVSKCDFKMSSADRAFPQRSELVGARLSRQRDGTDTRNVAGTRQELSARW